MSITKMKQTNVLVTRPVLISGKPLQLAMKSNDIASCSDDGVRVHIYVKVCSLRYVYQLNWRDPLLVHMQSQGEGGFQMHA